jgi:Secretion system C-terminal sorting domain/Subtilase family
MKTTRKQLKTLLVCLLGIGYSTANAQDYNEYQEVMRRAENAASKKSTLNVYKTETDGKSHRLSDDLIKMSESKGLEQKINGKVSLMDEFKQKYIISDTNVVVEIIAFSVSAANEIKKSLEVNTAILDIESFDTHINCMIPMNKLAELEKNSKIRFVYAVNKPITNSGKVNGQGDKALRADIARANFNVTGKNVKVGIISDSYNSNGGAATGVKNGELPGVGNPAGFTKPVVVLKDFLNNGGSDEGRAMAEIVHDVAPGAELYFHTSTNGEASFANGIIRLTNAGCKVIVDDAFYFREPFFQDGLIAKAIEFAEGKGVHYFVSAGNQTNNSYEFRFNPVTINLPNSGQGVTAQKFNNNPASANLSSYLPFFTRTGGRIVATIQWDEPFVSLSGGTGAKTNLDIYVYNSNLELLASSQFNNTGLDPVDIFSYTNDSNSGFLFLRVVKSSGPNPGKIKIVLNGNAQLLPAFIDQFKDVYKFIPGALSSTVVGHANSNSAFTVGAADYRGTVPFGAAKDNVEQFSSLGGTVVLFDKLGRRTYEPRFKPDFVAPDNVNTSFFGFDADNDGLPNFSGTSAAAPYAAAVAALSINVASCSTDAIPPADMKEGFIFNSRDMDNPETPYFDYGFDFKTGSGFIDAEQILSYFDICGGAKVANQLESVALKTYPNPVNDYLNIVFGDNNTKSKVDLNQIKITVNNFNGRQVVTPRVTSEGNNISLDVQNLPTGLYFATISNNKGYSKTIKFVK